jgi:hypothetical protein
MRRVVNADQYEVFVREVANNIGIEALEISKTPGLRDTLHLGFNDVCGRRHEVYVPLKTSPSGLRSMLRHVHGPKPRQM